MLDKDKLVIDLLKFAILKSKYSRKFYISEEDTLKIVTPLMEGGVCLIYYGKKWVVYYQDERYNIYGYTIHDQCSTAADDFYFRVTKNLDGKDGIYFFRERWQRETGLEF